MSPRVIQLPMSGGDRKHFTRELKQAERRHIAICAELTEAIRVFQIHRIKAHALACEEWNIRQFIGGPAAASPRILDAIDAGFPLLEVQCKRCRHYSVVDLTEVIWPRENQVHTLADVLRCQRCKREGGSKSKANLVALQQRPAPDAAPAAATKRREARRNRDVNLTSPRAAGDSP